MTVVMIYWSTDVDGGVDEVIFPGSDQATRAEARELIWRRVNDPADAAYRGCIWDTLSQRNSFDSDHSWYRPGKPVEVVA